MKKSKILSARLVVALIASAAMVNCGRNAQLTRSAPLAVTMKPSNTITGADTSRNTLTILRDATTDQCPTGGKVAIRFDDANGNGQPDAGEQVRSTTIHCHANGSHSSYSVQNREFDPDSQTCPGGGVGFIQFIDKNRNGAYDPTKGDQMISPAQTRCVTTKGGAKAAIGAIFRAATPTDCPASGGKGQVVQYFFDMNGNSKFEPNQGDSIVAEVPACATPKNIAAIQAVVPTVTTSGSCSTYNFALPSVGGATGTSSQVAVKSCGSLYNVGFLDASPSTRTCPNGGVMLGFYLDEDHDGTINTPSEKASVVAPFPLCFKSVNDQAGRTISIDASHVTTLGATCAQSGGAGTAFSAFLSKDDSGILGNSPGDTILSTVNVCDSTDGKTAAAGIPLMLPEARDASPDEVRFGHCSGTAAIVTQSRLFPTLGALQGWLRNRADESNQGRVMSDANIVCLDKAANAAPMANAARGAGKTSAAAAGTAAPTATAPVAIRNVTSILPAAAGQCTDGSPWSVITFRDHQGSGLYDLTSDGPAVYTGCSIQATASPSAQPALDGSHSEMHLSKLDPNADFPNGGYTVSVYDHLSKGQALEGAQHEDFAIANGPAGPANSIALLDLNSYRFSDPSKAPDKACDGVAVVNFYDTIGDGVFTAGKTPVLNEFALCESSDSALRIRHSMATDHACQASAGIVFESYIDREHAGRFVEGDPIMESVPYCPPAAVQPPTQVQQDTMLADAEIEGRVSRLSNEDLAKPELRDSLPYSLKSGKVGLTTYGAHLVSADGSTNFLKDTQVLYHVSFGLPSQDAVKGDIEISMGLTGVRGMNGTSQTSSDLFCLMDADTTDCSGTRYEGNREKHLNQSFWKDLPNGKGQGKATLVNEQFARRIQAETRLTAESHRAYKYLSGLEIDLGDMFPDLDQSRFLYSSLGSSGTREFTVEIADDLYASRVHFLATMKLPVRRNVAPPKNNALIAAAASATGT